MESQGSYFDDARFITGVLAPRQFGEHCTQLSNSSLVLDPKLLLECAVQRASDFAISLGDEQRSLFIRKHIVTSTGVNCKLQFPGLPSTAGTKRHREARLLKAEAPVSIDWFIFV